MAQVIPRRGGWYSDFRLGSRRIRRFLSKDKREAQVALGALIQSMRGEAAGQPSRDISWPNFRARYLEYSAGAKRPQSTRRDLAAIIALEREFVIARLAQVTPELLDRLKSRRLSAGKGKATVDRDLSALKAMMHKAEDWGYAAKQRWASVKALKITRKRLYFHSAEELDRLLARCHSHWRTVALLAARAGLRREEIHTLTWEDVDLVRGRIHIVAKDVGQGERWEPKDYEQRWVPIMASDLREHLAPLARKPRSRWVVVENNGERPSLAVMTAYMRKLARKAKLRGSLHILRHTFASHLAQRGVDLKRIKDWLGHSDMATTEIYAELLPDEAPSIDLSHALGSGVGSGRSGQRVPASTR
jgi:integrase